jgi:hypothetical protein
MAQAALMPATPPPTTITDFSVPAGKWIPLTPVALTSPIIAEKGGLPQP